MSKDAEQYPEGPRWEYEIENDQGAWRVVEEDCDHPAFSEDGGVDFFLPPVLTTDKLDYIQVEEGQTAEDTLRRHFGLPPVTPTLD